MRIPLHPVSLLAGSGLAGLCLVLSGMAQNRGSNAALCTGQNAFERPENIVRILEGDNFVVPQGMLLVIKTLASAQGGGLIGYTLRVDGQAVLHHGISGSEPQEYEIGVTAKEGQAVTVEEEFQSPDHIAVALGYLVSV
jgi:hypothetical protein